MTTPARKPASRVRAVPTPAPASVGAVSAPRKRSRAASIARSAKGAGPVETAPASFRSVVIENVTPALDGGRYPVKREIRETFLVEADMFKEGHDILGGRILHRAPDEESWHSTPLRFHDNDRWRGSFELTEIG